MKRPAIIRFRHKKKPVDKSDPLYRLYADILTPLLEWLMEEREQEKKERKIFRTPSRN